MELYAVYRHNAPDDSSDFDGPVEVIRYFLSEEDADAEAVYYDTFKNRLPFLKDDDVIGMVIVRLDNPLKAANYLNCALESQIPFNNMDSGLSGGLSEGGEE